MTTLRTSKNQILHLASFAGMVISLFFGAYEYSVYGESFTTQLYASHLAKLLIPALIVALLLIVAYLFTKKKWLLVILAIVATHFLILCIYQIAKSMLNFPLKEGQISANVNAGFGFYLMAICSLGLLASCFGILEPKAPDMVNRSF